MLKCRQHAVYLATWGALLADIGGDISLFLGLSACNLVAGVWKLGYEDGNESRPCQES